MDSSKMISDVTELLVHSFEKTAKDHKIERGGIEYMFLLKDGNHYKCVFGKHEINVVTGIKAVFIQPKINGFITNALLKFSQKYSIPHKYVNVTMSINADNELKLKLRNGYKDVIPITIEDLTKTL